MGVFVSSKLAYFGVFCLNQRFFHEGAMESIFPMKPDFASNLILGELKSAIDPARSGYGMAGNCLFNDAFKEEMKSVATTIPGSEGLKSSGAENAKESLITKKEAANRLAISVRTLDRLADRGLVEKIYIGGSVRIREREVAAIVEWGG